MRFSGGRLLVTGAAVAVAAALIVGILAVGPPSLERARKLDETRVADLAAIENLISSFAHVHKSLPQDLASLDKEPGYSIPRGDPESGKPYQYQVLSADGYRLCANFATRSTHDRPANIYQPGGAWFHSAGNQCFNKRVDLGPRHPEPSS